MPDFSKFSKTELEEIGRDHFGIELDRRLTKKKLIAQLEECAAAEEARADCACGNTEDEAGKCDGSHAKAKVIKEVPEVKPYKGELLTENPYNNLSQPLEWIDGKLGLNGQILKFAKDAPIRSGWQKKHYDDYKVIIRKSI